MCFRSHSFHPGPVRKNPEDSAAGRACVHRQAKVPTQCEVYSSLNSLESDFSIESWLQEIPKHCAYDLDPDIGVATPFDPPQFAVDY